MKINPSIIKSNNQSELPHATVKEAVQKRVTTSDHSNSIPGINVNKLKHDLDLMNYALDYSEAIVDTIRFPLVVLNEKLQILSANKAFYSTFKLKSKEIENNLIYTLNGNAWNIPKLKTLLKKTLTLNSPFDNFEVEINLPHIGQRTMMLNGRRTYRQVDNAKTILLAFEDITDRKQLEMQSDDFIRITTHTFKTRLMNLKVFSELLENQFKKNNDKKGAFYLSKITTQMERLTQLLNP